MTNYGFEKNLFEGKTAVMTGAGRGIGFAVASALAACGARVIAHSGRTGTASKLGDIAAMTIEGDFATDAGAPRKIRANAVSPGTILTDFHDRYSTAEKLEKTRLAIPLQRLGKAEDCVPAYLFLASEKLSGYITGQIIEINGGQLIC